MRLSGSLAGIAGTATSTSLPSMPYGSRMRCQVHLQGSVFE